MTSQVGRSQIHPSQRSANNFSNAFARSAQLLLIAVLCLGIFFRFANLDQKVYWADEVATAIRVSGFTLKEMMADVIDGPELSVDQLQKYQYPNAQRTTVDTINSLVTEDSQHPPLFFVMLRFWVSAFGNSVTSLRSLAAVFSVLILPAAFWLCQELFGSALISWVAIALLAVSPVQVVYAQEARQYSLWTLLIVLSSAALLRTLRLAKDSQAQPYQTPSPNQFQRRQALHWLAYGLFVTLGLYTHLLFSLIAAGHGLYVLCLEKFRPTRKLRAYLLTSALVISAYMPWILVVFNVAFKADGKIEGVDWMDAPPGLISMLIRVMGVLSRTFVDFGVSPVGSFQAKLAIAPLLLLAIGVSLIALIQLIQQTPFRTWFFVVTLIGMTSAVIAISYLVAGKVVASTRFMLPITLGMHLTVAYALAESLQASAQFSAAQLPGASASIKLFSKKAWRVIGLILLSVGILSCMLRLNTPLWWTQLPELNQDTLAIAQALNQQAPNLPNSQPKKVLVIIDATTGTLNLVMTQSLLHRIEPSVREDIHIRVVDRQIPDDLKQNPTQEVFIYAPFKGDRVSLKEVISEKYGVSLTSFTDTFWRVSP